MSPLSRQARSKSARRRELAATPPATATLPYPFCRESGDILYLPELKLCGDNGAMIGCQGYYEYLAGKRAGMDLNAFANRDIGRG